MCNHRRGRFFFDAAIIRYLLAIYYIFLGFYVNKCKLDWRKQVRNIAKGGYEYLQWRL